MALIEQRDWDDLRWRIWDALINGSDDATGPANLKGQDIWLPRFLKALDAKVDGLTAPELTPEQLDAIAVKAGEHAAALIGGKLDGLLAAVAANRADARDAVADGLEGGSAAVRADG